MQFFDLRNLNYYCDAKGHLEQPTLFQEELYDLWSLNTIPEAQGFLQAFKGYLRTPLFMFSGVQVVRLETYCFQLERLIRNVCSQILTCKDPKQQGEWSQILRKTMKSLRRFNLNVNKLGYKYNRQPWLALVFNDLTLDVLFFTEDVDLMLELSSTMTLFVKEEGVSAGLFRLSNKTREKMGLFFAYFLGKKQGGANRFYQPLTTGDQEFLKRKREIDEKFLKNKEKKEPVIAEASVAETYKKFFDNECFSPEANDLLYQKTLPESPEKQELLSLFFNRKLQKLQTQHPQRAPLLTSLLFLNLHGLYSRWNDVWQIYKDNKPDFFSNNLFRDGFLVLLAMGSDVIEKDKRTRRYFLDFIVQGLNANNSKLSELYQPVPEFLDEVLQVFFNSPGINACPSDLLIPALKRLKTIALNELLNLNALKTKDAFESLFKARFDKAFGASPSECQSLNVYLDYLTTHVMIGGEESILYKQCLESIEKFYRKLLDRILEKEEAFFTEYRDLYALYQNIWSMVNFAFNYSKPAYFEDLLFNFKLMSRFMAKIRDIQGNTSQFLLFSHTVLNNTLLNVFKKINVNEFINNWDSQEVQAFMDIFGRLTLKANLVVFRGVFIYFGSILTKHVFNSVGASLEKLKENEQQFRRLGEFIKVYLKDFILWTVNGYNDYPGFPVFLRPEFKARFIEFLAEIRDLGAKDQETIQILLHKTREYDSLEKLPCYYRALAQFLAYKSREVGIAVNRMRDHLIQDPENENFYTEDDVRVFVTASLSLQNPFSFNTSKLITANYGKEFYYIKSNDCKGSQLLVFLDYLAKDLPRIKSNCQTMFSRLGKAKVFFIELLNADRNLFTESGNPDLYQDYQRANHVMALLAATKDFELVSQVLSDLARSELLLGYYEFALRGFTAKLDESDEQRLYELLETVFSGFFELYQILSEHLTLETTKLLKHSLDKIAVRIKEDPERGKAKYQAFQSFVQAKVLGKKYLRKVFKRIDLLNYLTSFLKHLFGFAKNRAPKNCKPKLMDLVQLYFSQIRRGLLDRLKPLKGPEAIEEGNKDKGTDWLSYFIRVSFSFSEMFRLSNHLSTLAESFKGVGLLSESEEFFGVLTALFIQILAILKKNELLLKPEGSAPPPKKEIEGFEDFFCLGFAKYFHCTLFNEFLFPSLQTELLNTKENITMDNKLYLEKLGNIFGFIRQYSQIWILLNRNEESIPDSLQKNYERFYTKDPFKVANYISYGNKVVEFFLHLIYESKIRIKSNHIFLIIHTKLRAIPNSHKEKSVYVAYFARILEAHFRTILPQYDMSSTRKLFQITAENTEKIPDLALNFELPDLSKLDPIYSICLQALHINLIARLIQNTNDKEPNIPKGVELIFDTWDAKFEYLQYVNRAFDDILTNKIANEDHYAVFDETVFRGKEFLSFLCNNLKDADSSKVLRTLDLALTFLEYYLNIPIARESFNVAFVRLFNENKLDFSCILLCLGQLARFNPETYSQGIGKVLQFFQKVVKIDYANVENYRDFYNLQGFYIFTIFERILWTTGTPSFHSQNALCFLRQAFYDPETSDYKASLPLVDFSNKLSSVFHGLGDPAYLALFSLCEVKENGVFLVQRQQISMESQAQKLSDTQKETLKFLVESFVNGLAEQRAGIATLAEIENKEVRKTAKRALRVKLVNVYFILQILARIVKRLPALAKALMEFEVPGKSGQQFMDLLLESAPELYNANFSVFETIFNLEAENNDYPHHLRRCVVGRTLRKLEEAASTKELFGKPTALFDLYSTLSSMILLFKGRKDIWMGNFYRKSLGLCFQILEQAQTNEDFTLLNNMQVFFAVLYGCLKEGQRIAFEAKVPKQFRYDKQAINFYINRNLEKNMDFSKKAFDSLESFLEPLPSQQEEKLPEENKLISEEISLESLEAKELLSFLKEKKLVRPQIEGFLDHQKKSPSFSKKPEISGFLKHMSFGDLHHDFLKILRAKYPSCKEFSLSKRSMKRTMWLIPDDIADMDYGLRNYEETGMKFEQSDKKEPLQTLQTTLTEYLKLSNPVAPSIEDPTKDSQKPLTLQKNPSEHHPPPSNQFQEEYNIEISYDFELFGFPKNALSLYGVDVGIFISLPDDEKGNFLNEARTVYEERSKEISPELIQFLYDFEGNGFPPDALLKYGIDPLYFMEMPEEFKFAILDEARKKYNQDMKQLLEKEKENERANYAKLKEKILMERELSLISDKGHRVMKERRENLSEERWGSICQELLKLKDETIKAAIYKRMSLELINELPVELRKVAGKFRRDLADFPNKEKEAAIEEENKDQAAEGVENERGFSEELENFFGGEEQQEIRNSGLETLEKIEADLIKADFHERLPIFSDQTINKLLQALVLSKKTNNRVVDDVLFRTRYLLRTLEYVCRSPGNAYRVLDGMMFLLNDYKGYLELTDEAEVGESQFPRIGKQDRTQEINELHLTIIDFLTQMISKNVVLPMIFKLRLKKGESMGLDFAGVNWKETKGLSVLEPMREVLRKHCEKSDDKEKTFLDLYFDLLQKPEMEHILVDFTVTLESKLAVKDAKTAIVPEKYPIVSIFLENKPEVISRLLGHPRFFEKHYLKSLLRLFVTELPDFEQLLLAILKLFNDRFDALLSETQVNLQVFKAANNIEGNLKDLPNEEMKTTLFASFFQEVISKFSDFKSFSRALKYLLARFRRLFKKLLQKHLNAQKDFDPDSWKDLELLRSWLREREKAELFDITSALRLKLETTSTVHMFKAVIANIDLFIEFLGDDCSQENNTTVAVYKVFKCGFKAFIYVYSFVNPLEEVEYESLEKEDLGAEVPQLSKLLTLEVEDQKIKKNLHLDEVFDMITEKFCPILDYYVKSCSNTHNNNNLSHVWRYLIQKNTNFSTLSADTKFILIKNIAKERAKKITNQPNRRQTHQITVKRNTIWNSTLERLMLLKPSELALDDFKIEFENEEGWDAGGLKREWLSLLSREIFNPDMGLFQLSANGVSYQPSSLSYIIPDHLTHFRFVGRMIAKCLIENWNFGVYFPKSFLKHILKKNLNLRDLEDIDGSLARSLEWILYNPLDNLETFFTYERKEFDEIKVFDLVKDGSSIPVTEENKREFVKIFASTKMGLEIQQQAQWLIQGIHEIIPAKAISLLDEKELGLKIAGMPDINIEEMKEFAVVMEKYNNEIIDWLFEILDEYDEKMRAQFLFFTSGSFRVPSEGFKKLPLKIYRVSHKNALPVAHTCFNQIDLPEYDSKAILKEKLEKALTEGAVGFFLH